MKPRVLTPEDYLRILRRHWVLIVVLGLVGGPLAYAASLLLPNRYVSQETVLVEQPTVPQDIVRPVFSSDVNQRLASMQQQILSHTRLEPIIRKFGLYPKDLNRIPIEELVARLQKVIEVSGVQPMAGTRANGLPGFTVSVTMGDPQTAQNVCGAITTMFIDEDKQLSERHTKDTTEFLSSQLADAKAKLDEQDGKLAAFKRRYLGSLPDEEQTNLNILTGLTTQLDAITQALSRAQQDKNYAEAQLAQQLTAWESSKAGHNPDTQDQQLATLQAQLATLRVRYTDNYPDIMKLKHQIEVVKKQIDEANRQEPAQANNVSRSQDRVEPLQVQALRAQLRAYNQDISEKTKAQSRIQAQIDLYQERVQSSPVVEQQYKELTRGYQTALDFYNGLLREGDQFEMATDLQRQQQGEQFHVLDPANFPNKPKFPNRPLIGAAGAIMGLSLGLGLAWFTEVRDTSLRSEKDVESLIRLPVLAAIPVFKPHAASKIGKPTGQIFAGTGARG